ncbi:hypothetical protein BS47DRAFT_1304366 [Hydnum rufescens UP504]|uniref:ThuA-like domain-containing protein n=1 Tax=Hydnum rufescens UP504 TaxID=1448309 RepID=A0A9P6DQA2_9AGAM|nr:hypothetical protein BS47DRAFT_1304366 [Hydnum rufescens UP504]
MLFLLSLFSLPLAMALPKVLIYSRTLGFRHESIPTAISALQSQTSKYNVLFDATEDNTFFTQSNLSNYDAILFLSTTDSNATVRVEVLNTDEKAAFQQYLALGGNYIGVHSSSDSLTETPFFGNETGAYFDYHPPLTNATIVVLNSSNPSTSGLPTRWPVQDEMYNFKSDPRSLGAFVLLTVDESTYTDTGTRVYNQGSPHPIAWGQEHGAGALMGGASAPVTGIGRSWYTSLGHLSETWEDPLFLSHVMGGIQWALESGSTRAFNTQALVGNANSTTPTSSRSATVSGST